MRRNSLRTRYSLLAAVDYGAAVGLRKHRRETLNGAAQSFSGGAAIVRHR